MPISHMKNSSLFLIKLQFFKPSFNFIKKRLQHNCFLVNICERLLLKVRKLSLRERKLSFLSYQNSNRVREKHLCQFLQSCFPLAEVNTNNFLVSWNYGFQNSICSSKESIISRGSLPSKFFNPVMPGGNKKVTHT